MNRYGYQHTGLHRGAGFSSSQIRAEDNGHHLAVDPQWLCAGQLHSDLHWFVERDVVMGRRLPI